ncbi:MAG: cytochrome c oxidase subunit II [Gammaproteobacteria bacterium]|nr:cytochrome c oxidase subunit II [Gammaproteobacteria bacterium]
MSAAHAEWGLNIRPPVTEIGEDIIGLHNAIMWVCLGIFVVVFSFMFYSLYAHRKSKGFEAAKFHHSTKLEIMWTVIPTLILVALAIPSTKTLIAMEDTTQSDLTLKVTAYQWKWHYDYMDSGFGFFSTLTTPRSQIENEEAKGENYLLEVDNHMVVPANKKVRILLTANDVIHAWWVPAIGVKKDAIPGYINELWINVKEPGVYRGQCVELCGKDHGFMPIVVEVLSESDFDAWVQEQQGAQVAAADTGSQTDAVQVAAADDSAGGEMSMDELMQQGEKVYAQCSACHGANGEGLTGAFPAIAGSAVATGPTSAHIDIVVNGKAGTAMQAFKNQLNNADLAAVITYQRNAFGNDTGETIQPADIAAKR